MCFSFKPDIPILRESQPSHAYFWVIAFPRSAPQAPAGLLDLAFRVLCSLSAVAPGLQGLMSGTGHCAALSTCSSMGSSLSTSSPTPSEHRALCPRV